MSREKTTRSSFSISPFRLFVGLYLAAFAILVLEGHRADALRTLRYSLMFAALAFVTSRVARSIKDVPRPGRHLWAQLAACATAIVLTGLVSFRLGSEDDTYHEVVGSVYSSGCWQFALEVCAVYFVLRCLGLSGADLGIRRWVSGGTIVALLWIVTAFGFLSVDMMDGMPSPGEAAQQIFQNVFRNGFSEEFLFRGVLLSRLRLILTDEWALFVQALLFGIWHYGADVRVAAGNTLVTACFMITVQAVFGYALGYLTLRTRSIAIGSAFHAVADATSII